MSNQSMFCACAVCGGTECQCGCQPAAVQAVARQCVDGCTCGDNCTCPACHDPKAGQPTRG